MDKWTVLGIEKTKDKDLIKKAYRTKLVNVNPEDNQEGFMALRKAYDEAMYEADKVEEEIQQEDLAEGTLEYDLTNLYKNYERRIQVSEWQNILDREEFSDPDTSDETMSKLFYFVMDHSYLPQPVYTLFEEFFNVTERKEELYERFPKGFINHIMDNANYRDPISYYLFKGNLEQTDKYIDLYYGLDNAVRQHNVEEEKRLIDELEVIDLSHPYFDICKLRHELHKINKTVSSEVERREKYVVELENLQKKAEEINVDYPDDYFILLFCGDIASIRKDIKNAQKYYSRLSELDPEDYAVKARLGDMYCENGEYEAARDLFMKLIDINPYDDGARYGLVKANEGLINKYTGLLKDEPNNERMKYDLVWCYYRNGLCDKCIELLTSFEPSKENKCEYYDLLGRNYMYSKDFDKALESLFAWRDSILEIPKDDTSEHAIKHKKRFYYANYYIGECYIQLKEYEEARKYLEIATMKEHEYIEYAYAALCKLEYDTGEYKECLHICDKLLESSITFDAYLYMAKCHYQLNEYNSTIRACENAIACARYFYEPYVIMTKLYWECQEYERAETVIKRFELLGYPNDDIDMIKARLAMGKKENEEAIQLFKTVLGRKGTEEASLEDKDDYLNIYTLLAACYERLDKEDEAMPYLELGLEEEPDDVFFLNRIANVSHVMGDFERSVKCADRILEVSQDQAYRKRAYDVKIGALSCLKKLEEAKQTCELSAEEFGLSRWFAIDYAELLVRMNDLDGCVKVMEKAIEETEDEDLIKPLYGNLLCFYGNEGFVDKAYEVFKEGIDRCPDALQLYRSMGFVYLDHKKYAEAVELFKKAIELDTENSAYTCGLMLLALDHIDDISKPEYQKYHEIAKEQAENANSPYALVKKSEYFRAIKKYDEAIEACKLSVSKKREKESFFVEHYDAWNELANIYFDMGDYAKAKECFEKAQEIFGHNQLYIDNIAECETKIQEKK